jgi:restriction system protein
MARRNKSLAEEMFELTAMLPWWVGGTLAVVSYFVLHYFALAEIAAPPNPREMGDFIIRQAFKTAAAFGQYVLPFLFLLGAVASVLARRKRNQLHAQVTNDGARVSLEDMSWRDFEKLVGEYFRRKGFSVIETGGGGADGGVDLMLIRGMDRYVVQCKQWCARQVGVAPVRELFGVMSANGAVGGYVVTSGVFTDEAKRFADGREIELIAGEQLARLIREQGAAALSPDTKLSQVPLCPKCAERMVLRTARKGSNPGSEFWGCSRYPACRSTRPV